MLNEPKLHIEVPPGGNRFRTQSGATTLVGVRDRKDVVVHWVGRSDADRLGQGLPTALVQLIGCLSEQEALCAIDSALHQRLVTVTQLLPLGAEAVRRVLAKCDPSAESGVETLFRIRASAVGLRFRTQVRLPGGRVDFLFGDRLVVEVDGAEHHAGFEAFVADRERDAWHTAIGYLVVRFTYAQVVHRWHEVESVLLMLHARGDQYWAPRIRKSARRAL